MPIKGKYFPSQSSDEKIFLLLRRHWFTYAVFVFIALVMAIPFVIFAAVYFTNPIIFEGAVGNLSIIIGTLYFLFILSLILYGFIDYYLDVYIVTNERIVDVEQSGMFKRKISELHLYQVQDVKASVKGAFPTMLHYGDIHVQTAAENENFVFNAIPNPYRVSKMIADLHQAQIDDVTRDSTGSVVRRESGKIDKAELEKNLKHEDDIRLLGKDTFNKARKSTKEVLKEPDKDEQTEKMISKDAKDKTEEKVMGGINKEKMEDVNKDSSSFETQPKEEKKESIDKVEKEESSNEKSVEIHENEETEI